MAKKIVLGIVITLVVLAAARRLSRNNPQFLEAEKGGVRAAHTTVFEQVGEGKPVVKISVEGEDEVVPRVVFKNLSSGGKTPLEMKNKGPDLWAAKLPDLGKGQRAEYHFEIYKGGKKVLRLPEGDGSLLIKYKGHISTPVLALHIVFMFAGFFFVTESFLGAVWIRFMGEGTGFTIRMMRAALACIFIGGWPIGFILNYQRFGPVWEGFPFGYDVTDNKTQIIFLFWLIASLLVRGSFYRGDSKSDILDRNQYTLAVMVCYAVTVILFMVPHSL